MKNPESWLKGRFKKKYDVLEDWQKRDYLLKYINDRILKGKILDLDTLPPYIDKKLKTIIRTATKVDLNSRYQSCAEFLKALYDFQKGEKSWWIENDVIYSKDLKKNNFYRIVKRKNNLIAEYSTDKKNWRKKFTGTMTELIKKIKEHNNV